MMCFKTTSIKPFIKPRLFTVIAVLLSSFILSAQRTPKRSLYAGVLYSHLTDDADNRAPVIGLGLDYQRIFSEFFTLGFTFSYQRSYLLDDYETFTSTYLEDGRVVNERTFGDGFEGRYNITSLGITPLFYVRDKKINFYIGGGVHLAQLNFPVKSYTYNDGTNQWDLKTFQFGSIRRMGLGLVPQMGIEVKLGTDQNQLIDIRLYHHYQNSWGRASSYAQMPVGISGIALGYRYSFNR
jgi:hypothetical protein